MNNVRPQSLIFTLFGDYVHDPEERIRIGSVIKLLGLFGLSAQVVRTTVSRMVRRGWLQTERVGNASNYSTTPAAKSVIEEGRARIFQSHEQEPRWNGCWQLVTYSIPERQREARDRFRRELTWLGYGLLTNTVWLSPRNHRAQIEPLVDSLGIKPYVQLFEGQLDGFNTASDVAARCWDLAGINARYAAFIQKYEPPFHECRRRLAESEGTDPAECFVQRFMLVHEYRAFPYADPYLPPELLPSDWLGIQAAALFREYHRLLADGANKYFQSVALFSESGPGASPVYCHSEARFCAEESLVDPSRDSDTRESPWDSLRSERHAPHRARLEPHPTLRGRRGDKDKSEMI